MNKITYIIDIGLIVAFILMATTGILKFPGLLPWLGISYLQLPMGLISDIHDWTGITMTFLVLAHVIAYRKILIAMTRKYLGGGK